MLIGRFRVQPVVCCLFSGVFPEKRLRNLFVWFLARGICAAVYSYLQIFLKFLNNDFSLLIWILVPYTKSGIHKKIVERSFQSKRKNWKKICSFFQFEIWQNLSFSIKSSKLSSAALKNIHIIVKKLACYSKWKLSCPNGHSTFNFE